MSDAVPRSSQEISRITLELSYEVGPITISILLRRKLRHKEVK